MEKLIYLLHQRASLDVDACRDELLEEVVPRLQDRGASAVALHVDDSTVSVPGPVPFAPGDLAVRCAVSLWTDTHDAQQRFADELVPLADRVEAYLVTESVTGPDESHPEVVHAPLPGAPASSAVRSPGLVTFALVHRNPLLSPDAFRSFWYGHHSPVSAQLQPRRRYVRNTVVHPVSPSSAPLDGIVVETWDDDETVDDILAFHLGDPEHLTVMLDSVGHAFDMTRLRSVAMAEYLFVPG